jgi:hypothetical protein
MSERERRPLPRVRGLILLGLALLALYGAATLLGLRERVAVLTGTYGTASEAIGGVVYVVLHLAATALAPILLLAAAILAGVLRLLRGQRPR